MRSRALLLLLLMLPALLVPAGARAWLCSCEGWSSTAASPCCMEPRGSGGGACADDEHAQRHDERDCARAAAAGAMVGDPARGDAARDPIVHADANDCSCCSKVEVPAQRTPNTKVAQGPELPDAFAAPIGLCFVSAHARASAWADDRYASAPRVLRARAPVPLRV